MYTHVLLRTLKASPATDGTRPPSQTPRRKSRRKPEKKFRRRVDARARSRGGQGQISYPIRDNALNRSVNRALVFPAMEAFPHEKHQSPPDPGGLRLLLGLSLYEGLLSGGTTLSLLRRLVWVPNHKGIWRQRQVRLDFLLGKILQTRWRIWMYLQRLPRMGRRSRNRRLLQFRQDLADHPGQFHTRSPTSTQRYEKATSFSLSNLPAPKCQTSREEIQLLSSCREMETLLKILG
mmetsp:Transcript_37950/g.74317  ORF Transcript_37950/g.74317 Transcript_37950/m.74317 type:complete len:235 (-) Transcript_37950:110-814(-)